MSRIILVRHGEASWHAEDYDQLTPKGHAQAVVVGEELRARGIVPGVILSGTLRRHRETAAGLLEGAGWGDAVEEDERWNELDADDIVRTHDPRHDTMTAALAAHSGDGAGDFQEFFGAAMGAWLAGEGDHLEPYAVFTDRVHAALADVVARLEPMGTAVVVTSGGVQNAVATAVLGGGPATWERIFGMFPNTGLVRIAHSERGLRLLSMGETSHLERRPELLSDF
ncbi:MAG: histidine phosphatase family protein [Dermatophilaceae bacterium]